MSVRTILRNATRDEHDRVDTGFSKYDLATAGGYRRFLTRQAAAHLPVEAALEAAGVADAVADWPERRRADKLRADLADLGHADIDVQPCAAFESEAAMLGGLYVLEGSRLGGALLVQQVSDGLPTRFLAKGSSSAWRALLDVLETKLTSPEQIAGAVAGARSVFACFEAAASRDTESE